MILPPGKATLRPLDKGLLAVTAEESAMAPRAIAHTRSLRPVVWPGPHFTEALFLQAKGLGEQAQG